MIQQKQTIQRQEFHSSNTPVSESVVCSSGWSASSELGEAGFIDIQIP